MNLMCEVRTRDDGEVLYESGLLHPGEYIESLEPKGEFENTKYDIEVLVRAFESETYHSAGETTLKLVLQPW